MAAAAAGADTLGVVRQRLAEMREMRARDLKQELMAIGADVSGCLDKESLLSVLEEHGEWLLVKKFTEQDSKQAQERERRKRERWAAADAVMGDDESTYQPDPTPDKCKQRMLDVFEDGNIRRLKAQSKFDYQTPLLQCSDPCPT